MPTVYTEVEVDVDLDDFDTDDLIEELERRGRGVEINENEGRELLLDIWQKKRLGKDYQTELDNLIYTVIGKVI